MQKSRMNNSNHTLTIAMTTVLLLLLIGCQNNPVVTVEPNEFISALPENVLYPTNNPYTQEKEDLGRLLYWDPILSGTKDVACASCHHPNLGYADGLNFSRGVLS